MSKIECYQCHKKGHYKSECLENPRDKKREEIKPTFMKKGTQRKSSLKNVTLGTYSIKSFALHNLFYIL